MQAALKINNNCQCTGIQEAQIPIILGTLFLIDDPSLSSEGEIMLVAWVGGGNVKVVEGGEVVVERVLDGELNGRGCIDVEESRELGCIVVDVGRGSFGLLEGKG